MKEYAELKNRTPIHAEGNVCVELKDPITGKVKFREKGPNHVFPDVLKTLTNLNSINNAYLELSDNTDAIDPSFPLMTYKDSINVVGYGVPSSSGAGLYQGAYNPTNQILARQNGTTSLYWKFQYDFTTAQANGTIGRIGLTQQNCAFSGNIPPAIFNVPKRTDTAGYTNDGRYSYSITTAGIISKRDMYTTGTITIDVSAITGADSAAYKYIAYNPVTGKCYVCVFHNTASLRKVYCFSASNFATLESTYSVSNYASGFTAQTYAYGNWLYTFTGSNAVTCVDFVNNTAGMAVVSPTTCRFQNGNVLNCSLNQVCTLAYKTYMFCVPYAWGWNYSPIFDMAKQAFVGLIMIYVYPSFDNNTQRMVMRYPLSTTTFIPSWTINTSNDQMLRTTAAIAMKKLDTPVVKTTANGMTVTYELEVFY